MKLAIFIISAVILQGCISLPSVESVSKIIDKSGKAVGTVLIAKAGKTLAETRKIKAETGKAIVKATEGIIISLSDEKDKVALTSQAIEARVSMAKNTRYRGWFEGIIFLIFIQSLARVVRYFFPQAKKETKKY